MSDILPEATHEKTTVSVVPKQEGDKVTNHESNGNNAGAEVSIHMSDVHEEEDTSRSKKKRAKPSEDEVIVILSSDDESKDGASYDDEDGFVEWDSDDWEGPADEVPDYLMYAVVRACPHGSTTSSGNRNHSSEHVKVLAVFKSKGLAEERAEGIRARLDHGGQGDGMVPGGTGWDEEVEVWVQQVNAFRD